MTYKLITSLSFAEIWKMLCGKRWKIYKRNLKTHRNSENYLPETKYNIAKQEVFNGNTNRRDHLLTYYHTFYIEINTKKSTLQMKRRRQITRRMRITWTEHVIIEKVLSRMGKKRTHLLRIRKRLF